MMTITENGLKELASKIISIYIKTVEVLPTPGNEKPTKHC